MTRNRSSGQIASKLERFMADQHYSLSVEDRQLLQETVDLLQQVERSGTTEKTVETITVILNNLLRFFTNETIIKVISEMTETLF